MEFVLVWVIASIVVSVIASSRGRNGFGWFALSLLLSPLLAGILALVLPSKLASAVQPSVVDGTGRKCPMCAEIVRAEAIKCRFCSADLPVIDTVVAADLPPTNADPANNTALVIAVVLGLLAAVVLVFTL